jgi:hypothetical protein
VFDFEPAFLDVDVGCAEFAHSPELDQMSVRARLAHGKGEVECAEHIVALGLDRVIATCHRERRGGLFGEMNECVRAKAPQHPGEKLVVLGKIAMPETDRAGGLASCHRAPALDAGRKRRDRLQGSNAALRLPPLGEIVDRQDLVAATRKVQEVGQPR